MLTALIVDDEFEIREGLRKRFPWDKFGINQVLVADDGDSALRLALDQRPDLILTDIKMNRMSGLEFLRSLEPYEDYKPETIVVSGYDDFELAKQALQIGVLDYILKPINLDELDGVVSRITDHIYEQRVERQHEQQLFNQMRFAIPKMREDLLREMFELPFDPHREARQRHRLQSLNLEWMSQHQMMLLVVEADDLKAIENRRLKDKELVLFGIGNVVNQTLEEEYPYPFAISTDRCSRWVVMLGCMRQEHAKLASGIAQLCIQRINEFVKVKASAGMRTTPGGLEHLHDMFVAASDVLERKALFGGNRLFTELWQDQEGECDNLSLREPDEVLDMVKYGSDEDISAAMDHFIEMVQAWRLSQLKDIQQEIFQWLFEIFRKAASSGVPNKRWGSNPIAVWELLEQYDTLQSLKEQTERFLLDIAADFRTVSAMPSQIVCEAERLMHNNYADSLTLHSVASAVHVTPVWLSKLFKKEKRMTFLEYLTNIRIEKAKEMLGDIQFKVYQISYQVGYKDPVHFSKLFKKQVGCTPKEYRRQKGIAEE
ncbi:response regulator [Paenibacillus radicis (ex Gao et al. 2016)]|uniref:DNA-binding response regulator n=1 Tax=Paenibacillus radicis (ex Gao et al. 2016) TaxID=1737354 RepID=A0A917GR01_9BACL|nr:response regulator [Paenibacillus radicis (ex Gao et al. 2016)]GGG54532.1 hypothetical protein GCM10010918_04180 [Paenibacillus radicis (ex Gao et al. 2016)]